MKYLFVATMFLTIIGMTQGAYADSLIIKPGDSIPKILEDRKGKQVTLRLSDGEEITGKVRTVTKELVQIGELSGRDYFEGIIEVGMISAVIIRVKE